MRPDQKKANVRLALILASVAAIFMFGIFAKMAWLGS
ncbi:MAG: cytochrome oxidase small assembly protein [Burkholderiaceae bacterium]